MNPVNLLQVLSFADQAAHRQQQGLGWLGDLLPGDSIARVGFSVKVFGSDPDYIKNAVEGCLYNSGAFYSLTVQFTQGYFNSYLAIQGRTTFDFAQAEDFGGYVEQVLRSCMPDMEIVSRDAVVVDAIPKGAANAVGVAQPNFEDYRGKPEKPKVDCSKYQAWDDWIACQLGVSPSQAVMVGVLGALLGIVLINKVAK